MADNNMTDLFGSDSEEDDNNEAERLSQDSDDNFVEQDQNDDSEDSGEEEKSLSGEENNRMDEPFAQQELMGEDSGEESGSNKGDVIGGENDSSDSDDVGPKPMQRGTLDSSSDEEKEETETQGKLVHKDLFGDADDISEDEEAGNASDVSPKFDQADSPPTRIDDNEQEEKERMETDIAVAAAALAEEEEEEEIPETRIEVEIPKVRANLGSELHFVKLPNFLSMETRPFDPSIFEDEIEEDEVLDEEGRARLKLKVENTIRWKKEVDPEGNEVKASNARMVKWSDGSMSLHLGSEVFDVYKTVLHQDHNHLFIRQGTGLQGQAVFKTKLTFRPHSTDSATHRKMTITLADRDKKTQKIRMLPIAGKDPESHRAEMIKKEEERLRAAVRRESQQRRMREKSHTRGLSASYLEPDRYEDFEQDEGGVSLSAIKDKYKKDAVNRDFRPTIYSSDENSDEERNSKKLMKAKRLESDEDEDDLDFEDSLKPKASRDEPPPKKTRVLIVSDEESD